MTETRRLPKITTPTFTTILPSNGKEVRYRGFTVKEEKLMLVSKEAEDVNAALDACEQIITNCTVDVDVASLPIVDFTWLTIAIRSQSVNNKINIVFVDNETEEEIKATIDLNGIEVVRPENPAENKISLDGFTLFIKLPGFRVFRNLISNPQNPNYQYEALCDSLEMLVSDEEVYKFSDFSDVEIAEFIESLPDYAIEKIKEYFEGSPALRHVIKYTRPSDNKERTFNIESFDSFFT